MASKRQRSTSVTERLGRFVAALRGFAQRIPFATFRTLPGRRRVQLGLLGSALVVALIVVAIRPGDHSGEHGPDVRTVSVSPELSPAGAAPAPQLDAPLPTVESTDAASPDLQRPELRQQDLQEQDFRQQVQPERQPAWQLVKVASGDTMEIIFRRLGLSPRLLHEVVHLDERTDQLVDLRPGDEIAFDLDDDGALLALRSEFDDQNWLFVERDADKLSSRVEPRAMDVKLVEVDAEITSSLFIAGKDAGLSDNTILRLAGIFGWDIDFALDIRRGDRFALVYEEVYRDGELLRQGDIIAARFINQGDSFAAVRYDAGNGPDYYAPDGRPMRKAFLRAPINFTRVSSNFNPSRLHPVTRRVRPHNGTDYAAPTGTPVWAAGDGTVIRAGYTAANGNYIFLKHGNHIVTRYLHLSKKLVSRGDRVRQGQSIGRVGATGMATGPHLHYEFLVNGRHRDPRRVDLPDVEPLPSDKLPQFETHAEPWLARLDALLSTDMLLADASDNEADNSGSQATSE